MEEERALERISIFKEHLFRRGGFPADPSKPTTIEARRVIGEITVIEYHNRFGNMSCRDIYQNFNPMPGVISLLDFFPAQTNPKHEHHEDHEQTTL